MPSLRPWEIAVTVTVLLVTTYVDSIEVKYKNCGSPAATVTKVTVDPCDNPNECRYRMGHDAILSIAFIPKNRTTRVTAGIEGMLGQLTFPYHLPNPDGCKNSGLVCDLIEGKEVTYTIRMPIPVYVPINDVGVRFTLKDQHKRNLACIELKGRVTY